MTRTLVILVLFGGLALGLLRATDSEQTRTASAPDWYARVADVDAALTASGSTRLKGMARALDSGLLFPAPYLAPGSPEALAAGGAGEGAAQGAPPLPTILSASVIDGVAGVQMRENDVITTVAVGGMTPGGWTLAATDLRTVDLVWQDVNRTLDILGDAAVGADPRNRNETRQQTRQQRNPRQRTPRQR